MFLKEYGATVRTYSYDLSQSEGIPALFSRIISDVGRLDIIVNNAGIAKRNYVHELPYEEWREIMKINLDAVFLLCKAFLQHRKKVSVCMASTIIFF